ncbi:MAG: hypothetical protein J5979_00550 [Lachnospiraceae bacterium]|nr:hypothetical protein [Lachnospiraceae bacterium]
MSIVENVLDGIVLFLNEFRENPNSDRIKEYGIALAKDYYSLRNQGIDFLGILDQEFENDTQLYLLILSVLFFLFKEKKTLDKAEELLQKKDLTYDTVTGIRKQIDITRFHHMEYHVPYKQCRKIHHLLIQRLKEELKPELIFVPWEQRNHRRILLVTDTLLTDLHAPTKLVLGLGKTLQEELEYEVNILVAVENFDVEELENTWLYPYHVHYLPQYDGEFVRDYQGAKLQGFQQVVDEMHFVQVRETLHRVQKWKPEMIWYIGGTSVIADVLSESFTLAAMPCTDGYAVSDAPVLISYMKNGSQISEMEQVIQEKGQKTIDISLTAQFVKYDKVYSPEEFGIPKDSFIIAIVGNRLDTEINHQFIRIMEEIALNEERVYFVTIGKCSIPWKSEILNGRVVNLGYHEDLVNVLMATHLFLNPERAGGGGGAYCAIIAEVPVVTLPGCDIANVGEAFVCDCLEEYPGLVSRYCHDEDFYQRQVEACRNQYDRLFCVDHAEECKKVIEQTRLHIKKNQIR